MQSILLLLSVYLIPSIQSLECTSNCYIISSTTPILSNDAWCYQYTVTFDSGCTANTGTPKLLFGLNTAQCYLSTLDFAAIIESTVPFKKVIYDDDTNPNTMVGIEFEINQPITICLYGTEQKTTVAPIRITDDQTQCDSNYDQSPDICGICDGPKASTSCFCNDNEADCSSSARPRGDLLCSWDPTNNRCISQRVPSCDPITDDSPCSCYYLSDQCSEGNLKCEWDERRNMCALRGCIGDNLSCPCIQIEQDCENEIVDFPTQCLWDIDQCIQFESTNPTSIPTTMPTPCRDRCGCFQTNTTCNAAIEDFPLDCIWFDECVERTTTTSVATETTETTDMTETIETTETTQRRETTETTEMAKTTETTERRETTKETETSRVWTRKPTKSPTPKVWSKKPTPCWNKPTPRSSGWGGSGKKGEKGNNGGKGGKP